ncbi:hypothetical protein JUJ52_03385 [Virgibacillus sp. AGTR]|uniref:hypothetical protein n=1 Tax=Virgibacillus sp. AGTR TaxID=2812055 RepID=UPI001D16EA4D|nr:hypothetical protein [Virgibacillus sp. AGTR]MCC2249001.1 hypothetical protein [Virgibacillus sp. AGTR]
MKEVFIIVALSIFASIFLIYTMPFIANIFIMENLQGFFNLTVFFLLVALLKISIDNKK